MLNNNCVNILLFVIILLLLFYLCMDVIETFDCSYNGKSCKTSRDCNGGMGYCDNCISGLVKSRCRTNL